MESLVRRNVGMAEQCFVETWINPAGLRCAQHPVLQSGLGASPLRIRRTPRVYALILIV